MQDHLPAASLRVQAITLVPLPAFTYIRSPHNFVLFCKFLCFHMLKGVFLDRFFGATYD